MPPTPLSFAKRVFYLIVLSRRRIEPSRCGRTDRPPHSYKIRIAKFHNAPTKFLGVESRRGRHDRFAGIPTNPITRSTITNNIVIHLRSYVLDAFALANVPRGGAAGAKTTDKRIVTRPRRLTPAWQHDATGIPVLSPGL